MPEGTSAALVSAEYGGVFIAGYKYPVVLKINIPYNIPMDRRYTE